MSSKERLKKFVEYKEMGRNKFEDSVGISLGYISSRSPSVGSEILEKIVLHYPELNTEWIITGRGNMIKGEVSKNEIRMVSPDLKIIQVPLISQYAQTDYVKGFADDAYVETLPILPIVAEQEGVGNYMAFEVKGDSMSDGSDSSYKPGDVLICREVDQIYWKSRLHFNKWKSFVVFHKSQGLSIKQIIEHNPDTNTVTLHSLNPLYEDSLINMAEIQKLFNVVKIIRDESR